jgi:hypothetical protein
MNSNRFAVVSTNELPFLIACIETGSYGIASGAMHPKEYDPVGDLRGLRLDDRVFRRFKDKILSGPFIITQPHEGYIIDYAEGCWHKVNYEKTAPELRPVWLYGKP